MGYVLKAVLSSAQHPEYGQIMEIGSMAGWDVPGADPKHYEESYSGQTSCANFEQKQ